MHRRMVVRRKRIRDQNDSNAFRPQLPDKIHAALSRQEIRREYENFFLGLEQHFAHFTGDDLVVGMVVVRREGTLLVVSELGYGKRSPISDYRITRRGGKGILTMRCTAKTGNLVAIKEVVDEDELMIMSHNGEVIRVPIKGVSVIGRATQGVRLKVLQGGDKVVDVARVVSEDA